MLPPPILAGLCKTQLLSEHVPERLLGSLEGRPKLGLGDLDSLLWQFASHINLDHIITTACDGLRGNSSSPLLIGYGHGYYRF